MELLTTAAPFVLILLFFWIFLIRPQQRRQREVAAMQSAIGVGDKVMLTSGIFGTVVSLDDDRATVELAPGAVVEVMRAAIGRVDGPTAEQAADEQPADGSAADDEQP